MGKMAVLCVLTVLALVAANASANLITNGDFQTGASLVSEDYIAGTSADGVWHAGTWTMHADAGPTGVGDFAPQLNSKWGQLRLFQVIAWPSSGKVSISLDYYRPTGCTYRVGLFGRNNGETIQAWAGGAGYSDGDTGLWLQTSSDFPTLDAWTHFSENDIDLGTTAYDKLMLLVVPNGNGQAVLPLSVDNVVLTPEPATLSVLGLGLLGLLRRRR